MRYFVADCDTRLARRCQGDEDARINATRWHAGFISVNGLYHKLDIARMPIDMRMARAKRGGGGG